MANIDNMTITEIKEYVEELEKTCIQASQIMTEYYDFMASVETFENEMNSWVALYETRTKNSLDAWLKNDVEDQEDYLRRKHDEAIASEVAAFEIAKTFARFVKYPS